MRTRDNSEKIAQLTRRKSEAEAYIAGLESVDDGVDRSGAIASERRNIAAYDKQISDLTPKPEPKKEAPPVVEIKETPATETSPK